MKYDVIIIGGGPAGLSAAVQLRRLNRTVLVISSPIQDNPLYNSGDIDNYLGFTHMSGKDLLTKFLDHAERVGTEFKTGRVLSAMSFDGWFVTVGNEVYESKSIILCSGIVYSKKYSGEERLLGYGVSYCSVCDGMLYRNKKVIVIGESSDAPFEANYLQNIGCQVIYIGNSKPDNLNKTIEFIKKSANIEIKGNNRVERIAISGNNIPCDAVFILRKAVSPVDLFPDLQISDGFIAVDRQQQTNIKGLFASGDCTGKPLQVSKAVGEGLVAAVSADNYLKLL